MRPLILLLIAVVAPLVPAQMRLSHGVEIAYTLSSPEPATHLYRVRMRVSNLPRDRAHVDLVMPVWTPGSYLVREFERNVQDFKAGASRWEKVDKNTWRVYGSGGALDVTYTVYANELSVRTSHLDDTHGYVNGASVFMYVDGFRDNPLSVTLDLPKGWDVATSLDRVSGTGTVLSAPDYDTLVDSPIESGVIRKLEFEALGKPHTIAIWGEGNYDGARLVADMKKIVETAAGVFDGKLPYARYVFIVHMIPSGGGGLEHKNSTTLEATALGFRRKESYQA